MCNSEWALQSPNAPKLSDRRSWRALCMVGAVLLVGMEAQGMTAEPVRSSAWLGVIGLDPRKERFDWSSNDKTTISVSVVDVLWKPFEQRGAQSAKWLPPPEVSFEFGDVACELALSTNVGGISSIGIAASDALNVVKPLAKEFAEVTAAIGGLAGERSAVGDESSSNSAADESGCDLKGIAWHCVVGAIGGVCGSLLYLAFRRRAL